MFEFEPAAGGDMVVGLHHDAVSAALSAHNGPLTSPQGYVKTEHHQAAIYSNSSHHQSSHQEIIK